MKRFIRGYAVLPKPNVDLKAIVAHADKYKDSLLKRETPGLLQNLTFVVENRPKELKLINELNHLKHVRTQTAKTMNDENKSDIIGQLGELKHKIKHLETTISDLSSRILTQAEALPNLIDESVNGHEHVEQYLNCDESLIYPCTNAADYDHKQIGERKQLFDFDKSSKVSGNSWYYLIGNGALLEQALIQFVLNTVISRGYNFIIPPTIVKNEVINACGFKPKDQNNEQQIYEIANTDLSLIGTSEIPLAAFHSNTKFPPAECFPLKYVGLSRSYRSEAGARGKDTKGLYRVHEFTKLELFHFTTPENSNNELNHLVEVQKQIINDLGLKAKVLNIPYNDLGAPAFKKFDIEAWMPGRNNWGELTSCSNCTDYQSRRLNIRYFDNQKNLHYIHTLNGTAVAIPRVIIAIIEQFYNPETDMIKIPSVLVPYMGGKEYI